MVRLLLREEPAEQLLPLLEGNCNAGLSNSVGTASGFSVLGLCSPMLAAMAESGRKQLSVK